MSNTANEVIETQSYKHRVCTRHGASHRALQAVLASLAPLRVILVAGLGCREFFGIAGGQLLGLSCGFFSPVHPP